MNTLKHTYKHTHAKISFYSSNKFAGRSITRISYVYTELFISLFGTYELDCATTKTDTAERSISIGRESLKVLFLY